jgi:hypothetical protein
LFIKKALLTVLPVLLIVFSSCSDYPSSIGAGLLKDDYIGISEINSTDDSLLQETRYFRLAQPLGGADRLLIGKSNNIESGILINFLFSFPDSIDTDIKAGNIKIKSASLVLYKVYSFGDTTQTSINFSVHEITSPWGSQTFDADSLSNLTYKSMDLASNFVMDTTQARFTLDPAVVLPWFKYAADTNNIMDRGIYLKPGNNNVIMGFQSISTYADTSEIPRLWIVYEKPGVYEDTVSVYPEADLSVVTGSTTIPDFPTDDIVIQAGVTLNSIVKFDLSSIPANSIINSAEISLTVDSVHTITGTSFTDALYASRLLDEANLDSLANYTILSKNENKFTGNITSIIQNIYTDIQSGKANNGIVLMAYDQVNGVERFAIKGANTEDAALRPYLKITYTIKK